MATNRKTTNQQSSTARRGFASMDPEKVEEIARKGGEARARQLGSEGYAEMGRKGHARSAVKS